MDHNGPNGQSHCQPSLVLAKVATIWGCEPCPCPIPALVLSRGLDGSPLPLMAAIHVETKCRMPPLEGPGGLATVEVRFGQFATSSGAVKLSVRSNTPRSVWTSNAYSREGITVEFGGVFGAGSQIWAWQVLLPKNSLMGDPLGQVNPCKRDQKRAPWARAQDCAISYQHQLYMYLWILFYFIVFILYNISNVWVLLT